MHPSQASSSLAPCAPHSSKVTFAEVPSCPPRSEEGLLPSPSHARVSWHVGTLTTLRVHSASLSPEFSHKPRWLLLPSVSPTGPSLFTPPGPCRPYLCLCFLAPWLSLHQPNPYYPGPPTDIWNTPFHPSCPQTLLSRPPQFRPPTPPSHTISQSKGQSTS